MMAPVLRALLVLAAGSLAACTFAAGRDFGVVSNADVTLGATTEQQVITRYGEPTQRNTFVRAESPPTVLKPPGLAAALASATASEFFPAAVPGVYSVIAYRYLERFGVNTDRRTRTASFSFLDDKLVGYEFASSFKADATSFDVDKASALLGTRAATRAEVLASLGPPSGRAIYPLARQPDRERWTYHSISYTPEGGGATSDTRVDVVFDGSGRELDFRIQKSTQPLIVAQSTGPGFIPAPIIIRSHH